MIELSHPLLASLPLPYGKWTRQRMEGVAALLRQPNSSLRQVARQARCSRRAVVRVLEAMERGEL